eukprot:NODE_926_length_3039_cov_1.403401.p1 type:complete len:392 gc:universal NODE_926_length_3039_cov_1.403401:1527-2702(+)
MQQQFEQLKKTFDSRATMDIKFRKEQLKKFIDMMTNEQEEIEKAVYQDLKKPKADVALNEALLIINEAKFAIQNLEQWSNVEYAEKKLTNMMDTAYIKKDPKGVALIIAPWNFPIQLALAPFVSLISSGCVGILKPSEVSSHTSACLKRLFDKYMDPKFYAVVEGGVDITTDLLKLPFDHIFYTGNSHVGKIVMKAAAENLATVTLELGGANPCFVDDTVDLRIAAKRIAWLKTNNCGQVCLATNYVFIKENLIDSFVAEFKRALTEMFANGTPSDLAFDIQKSVDYPRIINSRHFDRIENILKKIPKDKILFGNVLEKKDLYISPTIVEASMNDKYITEELFAPILPIIPISDFNEGISFAKSQYFIIHLGQNHWQHMFFHTIKHSKIRY